MKRNRVLDAPFFYGTTPEIMHRAAQLRANMTQAEKILWAELRSSKTGFIFRRQHPINLFIADFYCHDTKLVIEVDGSVHNIDCVKERDSGRQDEFQKYGIKTIRFSNEEVFADLRNVVNKIIAVCIERTNV